MIYVPCLRHPSFRDLEVRLEGDNVHGGDRPGGGGRRLSRARPSGGRKILRETRIAGRHVAWLGDLTPMFVSRIELVDALDGSNTM